MSRHGIPTLHKGRRHRSRLEARWAAFFDLVGWPYEYEPFDLGGWIPDFILTGAHPVLVEVKPVHQFPHHVADKIERSMFNDPRQVLILGCSIPVFPFLPEQFDPALKLRVFGWLAENCGPFGEPADLSWGNAIIGRYANSNSSFGFSHDRNGWDDRMTGISDRSPGGRLPCLLEVQSFWAEAGNQVQWSPR